MWKRTYGRKLYNVKYKSCLLWFHEGNFDIMFLFLCRIDSMNEKKKWIIIKSSLIKNFWKVFHILVFYFETHIIPCNSYRFKLQRRRRIQFFAIMKIVDWNILRCFFFWEFQVFPVSHFFFVRSNRLRKPWWGISKESTCNFQ